MGAWDTLTRRECGGSLSCVLQSYGEVAGDPECGECGGCTRRCAAGRLGDG